MTIKNKIVRKKILRCIHVKKPPDKEKTYTRKNEGVRKMKKAEHYKEEVIQAVSDIVEEAERMRNAYFWTPPQRASSRRWYENKHSHPKVTWEEGGHTYSAEYSVDCSCRNIYAKGYYSRDGHYTTLTAIRNSLHRMIAAEEIEEKTNNDEKKENGEENEKNN